LNRNFAISCFSWPISEKLADQNWSSNQTLGSTGLILNPEIPYAIFHLTYNVKKEPRYIEKLTNLSFPRVQLSKALGAEDQNKLRDKNALKFEVSSFEVRSPFRFKEDMFETAFFSWEKRFCVKNWQILQPASQLLSYLQIQTFFFFWGFWKEGKKIWNCLSRLFEESLQL